MRRIILLISVLPLFTSPVFAQYFSNQHAHLIRRKHISAVTMHDGLFSYSMEFDKAGRIVRTCTDLDQFYFSVYYDSLGRMLTRYRIERIRHDTLEHEIYPDTVEWITGIRYGAGNIVTGFKREEKTPGLKGIIWTTVLLRNDTEFVYNGKRYDYSNPTEFTVHRLDSIDERYLYTTLKYARNGFALWLEKVTCEEFAHDWCRLRAYELAPSDYVKAGKPIDDFDTWSIFNDHTYSHESHRRYYDDPLLDTRLLYHPLSFIEWQKYTLPTDSRLKRLMRMKSTVVQN